MSITKYRYTEKDSFDIKTTKTNDKGEFASREEAIEEFVENLKEINILQQRLYAERKEGVVFVFQAMDAAGKDGCIRTVFGTLTPHGVNEFCFKAPSAEELSHDYLWRFWKALPARGNISIFNRSYYEDVLVGKVHKLYENQVWPDRMKDCDVIAKRYKEINDFEKYLYNNATRVVKIFLNVSKKEQAKRFISRIDTPRKNWKVSENDIKEREYWDEYQEAFESMINNTSCKKSPWYVVPADHKWYARLIVSRIILETLKEMNPQFPVIEDDFSETMKEYRELLVASLPKKKAKKEIVEEVTEEMIEETVEGTVDSKERSEEKKEKHKKHKKNKKKHKKHKKEKKEKNCDCDCGRNCEDDCKCECHCEDSDDTEKDINTSSENAFFDTSSIVTESYIEEEEKKIEEKKAEEKEVEENKTEESRRVCGGIQPPDLQFLLNAQKEREEHCCVNCGGIQPDHPPIQDPLKDENNTPKETAEEIEEDNKAEEVELTSEPIL